MQQSLRDLFVFLLITRHMKLYINITMTKILRLCIDRGKEYHSTTPIFTTKKVKYPIVVLYIEDANESVKC